ncbi:MAG TPA: hypothetical protein ENK18_18130 [Deltaproteobacteria bacterium]|nr:hypothetical protein [Deltaproteobacteria bacterium]
MDLRHIAIMYALAPTTAWGQAYVASDPTQHPYTTISEALSNAQQGDTITITAGLYSEQLGLTGDISLIGEGSGLVILSHSGSDQGVIELDPGVSLTLSGITLTSSDRRGIFAGNANTLVLSDVVFDGTMTSAHGGGISASDPATIQLDQVEFRSTSAGGSGGALYLSSSTTAPVSLTEVLFDGTTADASGGAIWASGVDLSCTDCTFDATVADTSGGGIHHDGGGALSIFDSLFLSTRASAEGGGVSALEVTDLLVMNSTLCDTSAGTGGGISASVLGQATLSYNALDRILANDASAIEARSGRWSVINNSIVDADSLTGALVFRSGTTNTLVNNLLLYNDVGVRFDAGATGSLDYNYFYGNANDLDNVTNGANDLFAEAPDGDPQLASWQPIGDCAGDDLHPVYGSPLIDAGDPGLFDPDGGRSDIGYTGGPDAAPHPDPDADGYSVYLDCDEADPLINPSALELCDGVDNDCNDTVDDEAVDASSWYCDNDLDGEGDPNVYLISCAEPVDACSAWILDTDPYATTDCEDTDPTIHSQADELCDAIDHDCDGDLTLGAVDATTYYLDGDGDGFGGLAEGLCSDTAPPGYVEIGGDCNDANDTTFPGASDPCGDGIDQDCNGGDGDDTTLLTWHADADGDGFGDPEQISLDCNDLSGSGFTDSANATDCNDGNPAIHPGAIEACNGLDDDCSGIIDDVPPGSIWYLDQDLDGYGDDAGSSQGSCPSDGGPWIDRGGDCAPLDPDRHPGANEICDGLDNDCDGAADADDDDAIGLIESWRDDDRDGFGACPDEDCAPELLCPDDLGDGWALNALDCNDQSPEQHPSAAEIPGNDIDEDCDGVVSEAPRDVDVKEESTGCGCTTGSGLPGIGVSLSLLIALRRRRR